MAIPLTPMESFQNGWSLQGCWEGNPTVLFKE